jgi:hypothetical protein
MKRDGAEDKINLREIICDNVNRFQVAQYDVQAGDVHAAGSASRQSGVYAVRNMRC